MDTIEWAVMMILDRSYEEIHGNVKIHNIRLTNMSKNDKNKFVDLIVSIDNKKIVIELNNNFSGNYLRNTLYALNSINNAYIEGGNYYSDEIQGILVNLNWITSKRKSDYSKKEIIYSYPKEGRENEYLLKIINVNLAYYENKCYTKFKGVDRLSKLLTVKSKDELKEIADHEKLLNYYYNKMDRLSHSEDYCKMIWDERIETNLRNAEAYDRGKDEGREEGINSSKEEIACKMYNNNIPLEIISNCVDLPVNELKKIFNKI